MLEVVYPFTYHKIEITIKNKTVTQICPWSLEAENGGKMSHHKILLTILSEISYTLNVGFDFVYIS